MGRKAIPIELLLINGNKNKLTKKEIDARKEAEQKLKPRSDRVKPPTWLSPLAKKEFKRLAAELNEVGLITNVDVNQLAVYCRAYGKYVELQEGIYDPEIDQEIVDEKTLDTLYKQLKSMAIEFGFTPSSRAKLAMPKEEGKPKSSEEKMYGDV
ncbi:phage terminase small subunit P27 family [Mesobacillus stamsii]|uniref:P27 family predicted phage terminase small subunit n=1 Tax=Mesobacillus stamsii TaxID=225347 RepID=A0ABU0FWD4_9BACI|nr:phage terminase small subunit P27 family [Mesobacillus stamsii]MDQ0414224.1 P27 family predicted phage terminase small subunit [Mesobacillus stamsii]